MTKENGQPEEKEIKEEKKPGRIKQFFLDFKAFINRGNVLDLAIAVIIGAAFTAIVTSLNKDIITPLITAALGKTDVSELVWTLYAADGTELASVAYGKFIQAIIDFLITAFIIFAFIRYATKASNLVKKTTKEISEKTEELVDKAVEETRKKYRKKETSKIQADAKDTVDVDDAPPTDISKGEI